MSTSVLSHIKKQSDGENIAPQHPKAIRKWGFLRSLPVWKRLCCDSGWAAGHSYESGQSVSVWKKCYLCALGTHSAAGQSRGWGGGNAGPLCTRQEELPALKDDALVQPPALISTQEPLTVTDSSDKEEISNRITEGSCDTVLTEQEPG